VVVGLRARRDEIEHAIFERIRQAVPDTTGDGDVEYTAGLRATVTAAVEFVLKGIERTDARTGQDDPGPIPAAAIVQAQRAARSGVSLGTVLRRYTVGYTLLGDFVVQEAESANIVGGLRELLGAQASSLERLTAAVADEYGRELERVSRSPGRRRLELVQGLLAGGVSPDVAGELGYELEGWHLGVIATGTGAGMDAGVVGVLGGLRAELGCRLLSVAHGEQSVWAWFAGGRRRVGGGELERLLPATGLGGVSLAVGEPGRGLAGWRLTHQQAQAVLLVVLRRPRDLTQYGDVALLAAALKDEALARALHEIYLSPLADSRDGGSLLRETLHAYFAAGRIVSSTAVVLGVARSTVESRLRTIEERLGRALHPCSAELEIALHLDELGC
jgi:hypothetical protein